jgi:hypothetical protein
MSKPVIDSEGNKKWFNSEGELHRLDGQAIERNTYQALKML